MIILAACLQPAAAAGQGNPFGINIHAPTGADLTLIMDRMQAAGIGWASVGIVWPYVEASPGVYDWSSYDAIVAAAQAHHINLVAGILYVPAWATTAPTWIGPPETAPWVDFCTQAATHFKGSINHWMLWNEPNQQEFWTGTRQQFIDNLLIPGADAIHAANPAAQVGGPSLAHLDSADWYDWLADVLQQAGGHLDFVSHHVYDSGGNRNVTAKLNASTTFGGEPALWPIVKPSVREVLQYAGWFGKPFWLTETGWQSGQVGETLQAAYYGGLLTDWFGGYSGQTWIDRIIFYEMQDPPNATTWGILNAAGSPKMAYGAYQSFISGQGGKPGPPGTTDGAHLVSANIPAAIDAGQTITVRLTFQNSGTSTWTAAANYKLGADGDSDPFAAPRQLLAPSDAIAPGQQKTFTFAFTAPANPGTYTTHWQMLREGVAWFGDELSQQVTVNAAPSLADRTLALQGGRFAVTVSWHDPQSNNAGFGVAVPGTDETGTFWFFSAANTELVIKVLDARSVNKHFWFFYGALSTVEYWITATDLVRGTVATYYNPPGNLCGGADTSTFGSASAGLAAGASAAADARAQGPVPEAPRWFTLQALPDALSSQRSAPAGPASGAGPAAAAGCTASEQDLCLLAGRFQVSVTWSSQGMTGSGTAASLSDETGTFAFFDPQAIDLVVKVIDGRALTGKFWFFYGALSDVAYTITLTDTMTGSSKQYQNAQGNLCGVGDTNAIN
jgi:hypothetical protein